MAWTVAGLTRMDVLGVRMWVWTPEWLCSEVIGESLAVAKVGKGERNALDLGLKDAGP